MEVEYDQPKPRQFSRRSQGNADMGKLRRTWGCRKYFLICMMCRRANFSSSSPA